LISKSLWDSDCHCVWLPYTIIPRYYVKNYFSL